MVSLATQFRSLSLSYFAPSAFSPRASPSWTSGYSHTQGDTLRCMRAGLEIHGLTVMSTSFLSSTLLDAGSVVLFKEPHPAKNTMQIRHAINLLIFITEHLLPSACQRSLLHPLPPSGQRPNSPFDASSPCPAAHLSRLGARRHPVYRGRARDSVRYKKSGLLTARCDRSGNNAGQVHRNELRHAAIGTGNPFCGNMFSFPD